MCVFVSLSVKAVHLELASDLTTEAFIACLRRFVARRGKPSLIWSDNGKNFVGAKRELKELTEFLRSQQNQGIISDFCSMQGIQWDCIPQHGPHFGGLWEAAVKSFKNHLRRVAWNLRLTFEEMCTVLSQIEACLNSRPLTTLNEADTIEVLTLGHFIIGRPLESIPDPPESSRSPSLCQRWHLCQSVVHHFWKRWSDEYLINFCRFHKWHHSTQNLSVGDVVLLREDNVVPAK